MKMWTKIGLITAGISAALGMIAVITGICMGGDLREMESSAGVLSLHEKQVIGHKESQNHHKEYHCSYQGIERLKIEAKRAKINVCETEKTEMVYYSNRNRDISKIDGTTWKIEDLEDTTDCLEITLFLPAVVFQEIAFDVSVCEMNAESLVADTISMKFDEAAVMLEKVYVSQLAKMQVDAGSLEVGYFAGPKLEAECDMGSINITCAGEYEEYNYRIECDMGEVIVEDTSYSGLNNVVILDNDSDKSIEAECDMGEIVIDFE